MKAIVSVLFLSFFLFIHALQAQQVKGRTRSGSFGISEPKANLSVTAEFLEPSGNGALDAGEKGVIKLTVVNYGSALASNVAARLTSNTVPVGITFTPSQVLGNIAQNTSKVVSFEVISSEKLPSQTITFMLEVTDASGVKAEQKSLTISTKDKVIARDEISPQIQSSAAEWFAAGTKAYQNFDYESAIKAFQKTLLLNPKHSLSAYDLLGSSFEKKGDYKSATHTYLKAIDLFTDPGELLLRLLTTSPHAGMVDTVKTVLYNMLKNPKGPMSRVLFALAYLENNQGSSSKAKDLLKLSAESQIDEFVLLVEMTKLSIRLADSTTARELIRRLQQTKSYETSGMMDLAQFLIESKNFPLAESLLLRVLKNEPNNLKVNALLSKLYSDTGRSREITQLLLGLDLGGLDDQHLNDVLKLCQQLIKEGKAATAENILLKLTQEREDFLDASTELMKLYRNQRRIVEAVDLVKRRVNTYYFSKASLSKGEWYLQAAKVYLQAKELSSMREHANTALESYKHVLLTDPGNWSLLTRTSFCNLLMGDFGTAEGEYKKYVIRAEPAEVETTVQELQEYLDDPFIGKDVKYMISTHFSTFAKSEERKEAQPSAVQAVRKETLSARDQTPPEIQMLEPNEIAERAMKIVSDISITVKTASIKIRGIARDTSGVAIVRVNEREASLKPVDGAVEFTAEALLTFGVNSIEISAIDIHQNVSKKAFKVLREVSIAKEEITLPQRSLFKGYQVWAAVIGISDYQSPEIPDLRYADRDAEVFYEFLTRPLEEGGRGLAKNNVRKLINQEATKTNIQEAIFDFMKNALEEDIAIIFFAGHGAPDPDRPSVPYLLSYDADLKRPAATAVKMQEIQDAIRDYIKARKVIVFADACHSAGVSTSVAMRGLATAELINQFLEEIAKAGNSVLTFSSSEAKEYSQESPNWGGGHGVFTYHILEGLKGKADIDSDGIVRLGELVDYVSTNVRRETKSLQHPTASPTAWDRNLPFSISSTEK